MIKMEITVDDKWIKKMEKVAPEIVSDEVGGAVKEGTFLVFNKMNRKAPVDTGRYGGSITGEVENGRGTVKPNVNYAGAVEEGSPPHVVPIMALKRWADRHGVNVYALQKSIARKGTKAKHVVQETFEETQMQVYAIFNKHFKNIINRISGM